MFNRSSRYREVELKASDVKKAFLSLHSILKEPSLWKVSSIKSTSLSLIRLWGKVVYYVEKSYVDKLDARKPRDFSLFSTSHEFLIDQNRFLPDLS